MSAGDRGRSFVSNFSNFQISISRNLLYAFFENLTIETRKFTDLLLIFDL
jgi:hypothetical protein